MDRGVDIAVYSPDDGLQLIVEVKNRPQTSAEWAVRFRRNLLTHQAIPPAKYFLLALPDRLYLWKDAWNQEEAPPNYTVRTWEALRDYLASWNEQPQHLGEETLELALASWLRDVANSTRKLRPDSEADRMLVESGLYNAIKSGEVLLEHVR